MLLRALVPLVLAYDSLVSETQAQSGTCFLISSAVVGFQLPNAPLVAIEAAVFLAKRSQDLGYYPPLRPVVYVRHDAFAAEAQFDYRREVGEGWTSLLTELIPPKSDWIYFRLDGGLNNGLFMQPAKSLLNWFFYLQISYTYCPSPAYYLPLRLPGWFYSQKYCDSVVGLNATASVAVPHATVLPISTVVQPQTGYLSISVSGLAELVASPENYLNLPWTDLQQYSGEVYFWQIPTGGATVSIRDPRPGPWFLLLRVVYSKKLTYRVTSQPCFTSGDGLLCGNAPLQYIAVQQFASFSYHSIDVSASGNLSDSTPRQIHAFTAAQEDAGRRYALKLFFPYTDSASIPLHDYFSYIQSSISLDFATGSPGHPFLSLSACDNSRCRAFPQSQGIGLFVFVDQIYAGQVFAAVGVSMIGGVQVIPYEIGVALSDCGENMCHGDICREISHSPFPCHWCLCQRNHSGLDCLSRSVSNTEFVFWVLLLVGSNSAMTFAVWTAVSRLKLCAEALVFAVTMVTSATYHLCDTEIYCFGAYPPSLQLCDFYMSYLSIAVSVIYLGKIQQQEKKLACVVLFALVLVFCGVLDDFNSVLTQVIAPLSSAVVPLVVWARFIRRESRVRSRQVCRVLFQFLFRSGNFRWRFGLAALLSFALALTAKGLETNYNYWVTHSLWHVFIMLTPCFVLNIFAQSDLRQDFRLCSGGEETSGNELVPSALGNVQSCSSGVHVTA